MTIFCHNCEQAVDLPVEGSFTNPLSGNLTNDATFQCLRRDCWFAKLESERGNQRMVEDLLQQYKQAEQSREERLRRLQIGNAPKNVWECQNRFWARRHELEQEREDVQIRANQNQIPEPEAKRQGQKIGSESGRAQPKPQFQVQNQDQNKNQASTSAATAVPAQERANPDAQFAGNLREAANAREPSPRPPRRRRRQQERRYEEYPDQWEFDSDSEFDYEDVFEYPGLLVFLDGPWPNLRRQMSWYDRR